MKAINYILGFGAFAAAVVAGARSDAGKAVAE